MASGTKATSKEQEISQERTYGRSERRVKISALQEEGQDLTEEEVASLEKFLDCLEKGRKKIDPSGLYTKTLRECFHQIGGGDYLEILASLDELGYDVEWQNINSKWFVPQNRERIYTIGHLRGRGGHKILPIKGASGENYLKRLIPGKQANRVYNSDGISRALTGESGGGGGKTGLYAFGIDKSRNNPKPLNISNCITAREDSGVSNRKSEGTAVVIPVLTPDRISKRQNCYLAIRKLTPKECFRLQGWTDEYFEKAKQFNSDSQLYKQAGNGVTVDVVKAIGEKLREQENEKA